MVVYNIVLTQFYFCFLDIMSKIRWLLVILFSILLVGCSYTRGPIDCPPPVPSPEKIYTREEKMRAFWEFPYFYWAFKDCEKEKLCKYKDCSKIENAEHVCDNGREFWHHFLNYLEEKDMRLDYGESIRVDMGDYSELLSGAKVEIRVLSGIVEINTEALYTTKSNSNCVWPMTRPLDVDLFSGAILPPRETQYILKSWEKMTLSDNDVIFYTGLKEEATYWGYHFKITPLAKENRIAYKFIIPKDE